MSRKDKLVARFCNAKSTFPWSDLVTMLDMLGFELNEGAGSRVCFDNGSCQIRLHKPHPNKEVKAYVVKAVKQTLKHEGLL